jgi:hypothetical protein
VRHFLFAGCVLLASMAPRCGHALAGTAALDSANAARASWREAARALGEEDIASARAHLRRAARAWPEQPAYLQALARLDALAGDAAALAGTLDRLAALGAGAAVLADSAVRAVSVKGAAEGALRRLETAIAPLAASALWATLPDSTVFPEGLDADSARGVIYVGSIRHRTIYEVHADGRVRDLELGRHPGVGGIMGVRVDARRGVIWATTAAHAAMTRFAPGDSSIAALLEIDPADGRLIARYDAPPGEPHVLGDLAVGPDGDVYVTDSVSPVVYRLAPGARTLAPFRHPLFRSLQGVAPGAAGIVHLADYSHGLLRWSVAAGTVERLPAPDGVTTLGLDGIVRHGSAIYAVQNGMLPPRVVRVDLDHEGARVTAVTIVDRHLPLADEPTIATVLGDRLIYVANSQWEKYDESGARRPGTALARPVLLALPLTR